MRHDSCENLEKNVSCKKDSELINRRFLGVSLAQRKGPSLAARVYGVGPQAILAGCC